MALPINIIFFLLLYHAGVVATWFSAPAVGSLQSEHRLYYVGETLTLHCYKFSAIVNNVTFIYGNVAVDNAYVTKVNETYFRLDKPVTPDDYDQTLYQCVDGRGLIETKKIYTDYRPQNATDFRMIWLDQSILMTSWGFNNISFKNAPIGSVINFTSEWTKNPADANSWQPCPDATNTTCNISGYYDGYSKVFFRINVTNLKRTDMVSTVFSGGAPENHAKPYPVEGVKVETKSSTSAELSWTSLYGSVTYNVTYYETKPGQTHSKVKVSTNTTTLLITDLHPAYTYKFEVRCKYWQSEYLSDLPADVPEEKMPEAAPASAPVVNADSYYLDQSSCESNRTELHIYYQEVEEEDRNGVIKNYTAEVKIDGGLFSSLQKDPPKSVALKLVPCKGNFTVRMSASTDAGSSPQEILFVPTWDSKFHEELGKMKLRFKVTGNMITAEWVPPSSFSAASVRRDSAFSLHFCNKASGTVNQCEDTIQSIPIDPEAEQHRLLPSARIGMKFGISAVSPLGKTTGIRFTKCVYDPTEGPGKPPSDLSTSPRTDRIVVSWSEAQKECDDETRVIILHYEVKVCKTLDASACWSYQTSDGSSRSYTLQNLEPDVNYTVQVRAITTSKETDFSQPVYTMLLNSGKELTTEEIVGIAIGAFLFAFIVGTAIFCYMRNCRRKWITKKDMFSKSLNDDADFSLPKGSFEGHNDQPVIGHPVSHPETRIHINSNNNNKPDYQNQDSGYDGIDSQPPSPTSDKEMTDTVERSTTGYCRIADGTVTTIEESNDGNPQQQNGNVQTVGFVLSGRESVPVPVPQEDANTGIQNSEYVKCQVTEGQADHIPSGASSPYIDYPAENLDREPDDPNPESFKVLPSIKHDIENLGEEHALEEQTYLKTSDEKTLDEEHEQNADNKVVNLAYVHLVMDPSTQEDQQRVDHEQPELELSSGSGSISHCSAITGTEPTHQQADQCSQEDHPKRKDEQPKQEPGSGLGYISHPSTGYISHPSVTTGTDPAQQQPDQSDQEDQQEENNEQFKQGPGPGSGYVIVSHPSAFTGTEPHYQQSDHCTQDHQKGNNEQPQQELGPGSAYVCHPSTIIGNEPVHKQIQEESAPNVSYVPHSSLSQPTPKEVSGPPGHDKDRDPDAIALTLGQIDQGAKASDSPPKSQLANGYITVPDLEAVSPANSLGTDKEEPSQGADEEEAEFTEPDSGASSLSESCQSSHSDRSTYVPRKAVEIENIHGISKNGTEQKLCFSRMDSGYCASPPGDNFKSPFQENGAVTMMTLPDPGDYEDTYQKDENSNRESETKPENYLVELEPSGYVARKDFISSTC